MKKLLGVSLTLIILGLLLLAACVPFVPGSYPYAPGGPASGQSAYPYGPGGARGPGMMGSGMGPGMMGGTWGGYYPAPNASPITIDQAADAARRYFGAYGGSLELGEVMDFAQNYYAEVEEKDTGIHAMELLIDKYTGRVSPEIGPNIMWNTKYSPMGNMMGGYRSGVPAAAMPVVPDQAVSLAQQYLDAGRTGLTVVEADVFYGYYTLHTLRNGQTEGMLSVNGYTGDVWYHNWHGAFLGMKEYD